MSGTRPDLEERLRRVLEQTARQLDAPPAHWQGPTPPRRRRLRGLGNAAALAGTLVAVLIVVIVLATAGQRHAAPAGAGSLAAIAPPAAALEPRLSAAEKNYVGAAWLATVKRDPACRGFSGPNVTSGVPSRAVRSNFRILRTAASAAPALRLSLAAGHRAWSAGAQLYANQIHVGRKFLGATFYVLPAGNVSGQAGVPARCANEEVAALQRRLAGVPEDRRAHILAGQRRYLAWLRYLALHADGVCAALVTVGSSLNGGDNFGCATLADFERWGVLADANASIRGFPVFWTLVPDGVASVTLGYNLSVAPPARIQALTVHPVGNVVVAIQPKDSGFPSTIVLRASNGHILKKINVTPSMPTFCGYGC